MADIIVMKETYSNDRIDWQLLAGKKEVHVGYNTLSGCLNVLCVNASHRAYKMGGRHFYGHGEAFNEALRAYKSADMKSAITFALQQILAD